MYCPPPICAKLNFASIVPSLVFTFLFSSYLAAMPPNDFEKCMDDDVFVRILEIKSDSTFPCQESYDVTLPDGYHVSTSNP